MTAAGLILFGLWSAGLDAQDVALRLDDGGIQFQDGSVQVSAMVGFAPIPSTGQDACWDTVGDQIACAGTGQDGDLQAGVAWPVPRFTAPGDGTVRDNLTGLVWLQDANCFGGRTWSQALSDALALASGSCGLSDGSAPGDWRLPQVLEMWSLVDLGGESPAVPAGHPFVGVRGGPYWTTTIDVRQPLLDLAVNMRTGVLVSLSKNFGQDYLWPVRGGH